MKNEIGVNENVKSKSYEVKVLINGEKSSDVLKFLDNYLIIGEDFVTIYYDEIKSYTKVDKNELSIELLDDEIPAISIISADINEIFNELKSFVLKCENADKSVPKVITVGDVVTLEYLDNSNIVYSQDEYKILVDVYKKVEKFLFPYKCYEVSLDGSEDFVLLFAREIYLKDLDGNELKSDKEYFKKIG